MIAPELPFSQACENNKAAILAVLSRVFADRSKVIEVGSGTGQHATYFAAALPHLRWFPTELPGNLPILLPRCQRYVGNNLAAPLALNVQDKPWPSVPADALFTANTLHIMAMEAVEDFFAGLVEALAPGSPVAVYGPVNYGGHYTSESNARFDQWLAARDPASAIRDFEALEVLARESGFHLLEDNEMPANNRLIVWQSG